MSFFAEIWKIEFNQCMRMSSMFCQNASFLLSLVTACGPNYRLFGWNDRNWLQSISDFNRCLGKTHPLCNHSKTSGANHGFFHRQMWKMHFNQCMRMGSNFKPKRIISAFILWHVAQKADFFTEIAKTQALHNHSTACSPNFRLFCRKAKNGLKSIYANESNI